MASATLAPTGAQADAKATVVKVRNAASVKLDYLRSLATKLVATSRKGIANTVTFMRRSWGVIPVSLGGALISGITSTKYGYRSVVNFASGIIKKTFSFIGSLRRKLSYMYDNAFATFAGLVGKVNYGLGRKLKNFGYKVTDVREQSFVRLSQATSRFGRIAKAALLHGIPSVVVPIWSTLVGVGYVVNYFFGNFASSLASLIPFAGKYIVAALAGGWPAILMTASVAMASATVACLFKSDQIIGKVVAEDITGAISEAIAVSDIVDISSGTASVEVTGDVSYEQALDIAQQHVEQELVVAEKAVKNLSKPAPRAQVNRPTYPSKKQKKK